ncbi:MAG: hypothetical protein QW057_06005 [Candidatus Bathyarchaeia archaeon]
MKRDTDLPTSTLNIGESVEEAVQETLSRAGRKPLKAMSDMATLALEEAFWRILARSSLLGIRSSAIVEVSYSPAMLAFNFTSTLL